MRGKVIHYLVLAAVLLGVPLACAWFGGRDDLLAGVRAFPPRTEDWGLDPAKLWNMRRPFSWPVFAAMAAGVLAAIAPFAWRVLRGGKLLASSPSARPRYAFPRFGWAGLALGAGGWVLAWNRFPCFAWGQPHTYLLVWAGYILAMNALCVKRSGQCLMTAHPVPYALLFPVSAAFWWFFEYLNRYVWNWYYRGVDGMGAAEYTFFATCSFATVLPAVTATAAWLGTFRPFADSRLCGLARFDVRRPSNVAGLTLTAAAGLTGIVFCPDITFPLLWISPLSVFLAVQVMMGDPTVLEDLKHGDWRLAVRFALAALICGCFWEMWNFHSLAKWVYAVPYVHAFQVFEMPAVGFAGYLPFGLECAAVSAWVLPALAGIGKKD
ncbi:MAG: hypothetical protein PHV28_01810 [Kiritimatiellae bacterium]|nr:hypothetical protein [Kiritimatiellia bacterium]